MVDSSSFDKTSFAYRILFVPIHRSDSLFIGELDTRSPTSLDKEVHECRHRLLAHSVSL
ncbi:MAG: hypothetical protein OJF50_003421 [Nitrospira sp.]|nr:hypothetical protein [Nitrospira sp.]